MDAEIKTLGNVATYTNGRAFKPSEWENTGLPIIRIQNLNDDSAKYNYSSVEYDERFRVEKGDLLFAWSASLGAHIWRGDSAWLNQHIFKVLPHSDVDKMYLYYYLCNVIFDLYAKTHGSGMVHITKAPFMSTPIPIPTLAKQEQIVARIEELFSQLDKGVETLQKTKQQLAIYRQAVLNSAFEGYKEWPRYTFNEILSEMRNGYGQKPDDEGEYRLLRISSVRAMNVDLHDYRLNKTAFDDKDIIRPYDLLFTRYNGSVDYVGVCAYVRQHEGVYAYPDKIIKCRLKEPSELLAKYIQYYMSQGEARKFIRSRIKTTSGQNGIAGSDIKKVTVHIPESKRIERIIEEIEERMSACDNIEVTVQKVLQQVEAMRQSILKQAFEGRI